MPKLGHKFPKSSMNVRTRHGGWSLVLLNYREHTEWEESDEQDIVKKKINTLFFFKEKCRSSSGHTMMLHSCSVYVTPSESRWKADRRRLDQLRSDIEMPFSLFYLLWTLMLTFRGRFSISIFSICSIIVGVFMHMGIFWQDFVFIVLPFPAQLLQLSQNTQNNCEGVNQSFFVFELIIFYYPSYGSWLVVYYSLLWKPISATWGKKS